MATGLATQATPRTMPLQVEYEDAPGVTLPALKRAGRVRVAYANGDTYAGPVAQTSAGEYEFHGRGRYTWKRTGAWYEGDYDHGAKQGLGTYSYPNGTVYRGHWVAGHKSGAGTLTYQNGDVFTGQWRDDTKHGHGEYTYRDSQARLIGEWVHGEVVRGKWLFPGHDSVVALHVERHATTQEEQERASPRPARRASLVAAVPLPLKQLEQAPFGVIIAGAPASGKGTQCEYIKQAFGLVHLSSGDMLRAAVAAGTPVGKKAQDMMQAGELVPDDVVIGCVAERLAQPDVQEHGFLLDGFPRTPGQAVALQQIGLDVHLFVFLNVPDSHIVERVTGRRVDPVTQQSYHVKFKPPTTPEIAARLVQRSDDTEEAIVVRLRMFHDNITSVKSHYERVMVEVDGTKRPPEVWVGIDAALRAAQDAVSAARDARIAPPHVD